MPHENAHVHGLTNSGGVLDRRRALAIVPVGNLDSYRSGNPLQILKRRPLSGEDMCADAAYLGTHTKIHWTQLAPSGSATQPTSQHHNGSQAVGEAQSNAALDANRRELKVILTDVFQTEEGRSYLRSCGIDSKMKHQSECVEGARERWCERRLSAEQRDRKEGSSSRWDHMNFSDFRTTDTHYTKQLKSPTEKNYMNPAKESPLLKKHKRIHDSPKEKAPTTSDKKESCSEELVNHHGDVNELCLVEESDSVSPLCSQGAGVTERGQSSESALKDTPRRTPSHLKLLGRHHRMTHPGREGRPSQHNTSQAAMQESSEDEGGEVSEEEQIEQSLLDSNGEMGEDWGGARRSVLRLSAGVGSQLEIGLADGQVPPKRNRLQSSLDKTILNSSRVEVSKASKPHTPEPIVLSSEEEEEQDEARSTLYLQPLERAKDPHTPQRLAHAIERKTFPDPHAHSSDMHTQGERFPFTDSASLAYSVDWCSHAKASRIPYASSFVDAAFSKTPVMELQFSALHMCGLSAAAGGLVKITDDGIMILLKDSSGTEVKVLLSTAHVHKYSVWDGLMVRESGLVKNGENPPPSLLLLWLSEVQARRLSSELSVIQPDKCPALCTSAEGSVCVLLCVCEDLNGVEGALLASIMDIVGIRNGTTSLLSPLSQSESLELLQREHNTQLLQLLRPQTETDAIACEASAATSAAKDSDAQQDSVYTLCHSRTKGRYSVSMAPKPGAAWSPYCHRGPARRLIQFPPPPSKGAITVTTEDLECLDSGEFLNDVIIDFYLKYLLVQKAPHSSVKRSHIFSSFFYKQLTRRDNANEDITSTPTQFRRHQRVKTWTRHVDIFDKDFLFVPVNQEAHWYLVVICFPGMEKPQYVHREGPGLVQDTPEDSSDSTAGAEPQEGVKPSADGNRHPDEAASRSVSAPGPPNCTEKTCKLQTVCKRPCILIMDSLKLSVHERIFKLLREYLQAEWKVKRGEHRDFSAELMVGSHCKVPLQDNSSDCGLYLLQYAESFLQDPVVHFDLPLNLEYWFPRQQVREKREEIRDLVLYLYRFQQSSEDVSEMGNVIQ